MHTSILVSPEEFFPHMDSHKQGSVFSPLTSLYHLSLSLFLFLFIGHGVSLISPGCLCVFSLCFDRSISLNLSARTERRRESH